jgi:hypothetical protein
MPEKNQLCTSKQPDDAGTTVAGVGQCAMEGSNISISTPEANVIASEEDYQHQHSKLFATLRAARENQQHIQVSTAIYLYIYIGLCDAHAQCDFLRICNDLKF